jgi:hypothetical protein
MEALRWSAGWKMVGSVSHDEYIQLWMSFEGGCGEVLCSWCRWLMKVMSLAMKKSQGKNSHPEKGKNCRVKILTLG